MKVRLIGFLSGVVAGAAVLVLVMTWFGGSLQAQGLNRAAPKAWGVVKGGAATVVIFEDAGGTIRLYEAQTGMVFATITRE